MSNVEAKTWKKTACVICAINCGLEVQAEDSRILRIRGDKAHPASRGYLCEKSQRLDYYQNGADRLSSPMRRRADGSYEAVDWNTAIAEVAGKLAAVRDAHGGESILYYGGGGQGGHLGGTYAESLIKTLGIQFRSNALAQEKTGEAWVQGKMMGAGVHCDFEHAEVAVFLGKNPWQSHGFSRTRDILNEIRKDPARTMIVIDPRVSETAKMADIHLAVKPGTDAWCLAALAAIIVQEDLSPKAWIAEHTTGYAEVADVLRAISVAEYAVACGVDEALLRKAARRIASASSVSMFEDLGVQMNIHSTLNSYLNRLVWLLTGHYGRMGTNNAFTPLLGLSKVSQSKTQNGAAPRGKTTPVTGSRVIMGLIPCNVIPEEIVTDHPRRFRAMFIQNANPVHSLADAKRMREALRALEFSVVIDVAMTETAMQADYVLPAASQFEKAEATFFNFEFPHNVFHLRPPLFSPKPGTLPEAEILTRLVEALGVIGEADYAPLRDAAAKGLGSFAMAFGMAMMQKPHIANCASSVLYRALGPSLPDGMANAASLFGICHMYVRGNPKAAEGAGFGADPVNAANRLFEAILSSPSGVVFAVNEYEDSWQAVRRPDNRINLCVPEMLAELRALALPDRDPSFPFILCAGERRTETMNTLVRDASWHRKNRFGTLRLNPRDAERLGCAEGEEVRLTTHRDSVVAPVEISDMMPEGMISLPNGLGLDYREADGKFVRRGVSVNELTDVAMRDGIAGTPWHKRVPARLERLAGS